jgi:prepilin-type N-terminal cleavage/methylation domain-containing protein
VKRTPSSASAGFTLIELMIVVVVVGVLAAVAFMSNTTPATYTILAQGELLAANLRHTQTLATTWSRSLSVGLSGGTTYSVSCVTTSSSLPSPCNVSPVLDPATGSSFSVSLQNNVSISGPSSLTIDSLGKPSAAATYTLASTDASVTVTVTVLATTGVVTVSMQ